MNGEKALATPKERHDFCVRTWQHSREYYRPWNNLYGRLLAFALDMEHYRRDTGFTDDRRRVQPKGQQLYNHIRHKRSQMCAVPPYIQCRPVRPQADLASAELSKRVLEHIVRDPGMRYSNNKARGVLSMLAGGRGVIWVEHDPRAGLCFRVSDPRKTFVTPGFADAHDPRNPAVYEEVPMRLSALKAMKAYGWKVPDDIHADNAEPDGYSGSYRDTSRIDLQSSSANAQNLPGAREAGEDDGLVTVVKCYYRWDPFKVTNSKRVASKSLPMDDWYWQDALSGKKVPFKGVATPPLSPVDGSPFQLVDTVHLQEQHYQYPNGYLCVVTPYNQCTEPLFEDTWMPGAVNADVRMKHFPLIHANCYEHPLRLVGKSDTELNHTLQIVDNATFRSAWEQLRMAQGILIAQKGVLEDAEGRQFQFSDAPNQVAWVTDRMGMEGINYFQMPGMNPSLPAFRQMLERQWSYIGNGDVQMPADRSRNVPVGTIEALMKTGDLPVQVHLDSWQQDESILFRCALDLKRAYMDKAEMISWLTDEGEVVHAPYTADDLGEQHVEVTASPMQSSLDSDKVQAVAQFMGQAQAVDPSMWADFARTSGFDQRTVQSIAAAAKKLQDQRDNPPPPAPAAIASALAATASLATAMPGVVTQDVVAQLFGKLGVQMQAQPQGAMQGLPPMPAGGSGGPPMGGPPQGAGMQG